MALGCKKKNKPADSADEHSLGNFAHPMNPRLFISEKELGFLAAFSFDFHFDAAGHVTVQAHRHIEVA